MSTQSNNVEVVRTTRMAQHFALGDLLENVQSQRPIEGVISNKISLTEADSNALIDSAAKAIKFKEIDGDQDNSFDEGKDEDTKLDENGNFVGKGKTTIFDKKVDLEHPEETKERWVETSTGKVSDGETEQVPTLQGEKTATINEGTLPQAEQNTKISSMDAFKSLLNSIPSKN